MNNLHRKTFKRQQGKADCGIACLASVISYYHGNQSLERLRELSGTSKQGTTLLGLYQAATQLGFKAEGYEAESVEKLNEIDKPVILHVLINNNLHHYFVFYGFDKKGRAIIGDPAIGIVYYSKNDLNTVWKSKALLKLTPTVSFEKSITKHQVKKEWIYTLLREDIRMLLVSLSIGLILSTLSLTMVIFSQRLIDNILPSKNKENLVLGIVIVALLLFFRNLLAYFRGKLLLQQSINFNNRIVNTFFSKLLRLPKSFFDTRKIGELIARLNDTRRIQSTISSITGNVIIDLLIVIILFLSVFFYSINIGLLLLGSLPFYVVLVISFNKRIVSSQKSVMHQYAETESNYVDTILGISSIKSNNREHFFEVKSQRIYTLYQEKVLSLGKLNLRFGLFSEFISVGITFLVLLWSAHMAFSEIIKIGEMMAILSISSSIIPAINRLVIANTQIQEALIAFDRMYEFASIKPEYSSHISKFDSAEKEANLTITNLSYRFAGRDQLLKNISLQINTGKITVLMGESGSGKSTLLQIIQKFYKPESGTILFNNQLFQEVSFNYWRSLIGVVPQNIKIFNGDLLYNITLSDNPDDHKSALLVCHETKLDVYFNLFPQGYQTILGEEGVNISGGQSQILALARALFRKPKLLILDEATSAMDRKTENNILQLILSLKCNLAILLVTHRIKIAQIADQIYILEKGEISIQGTFDELIKTDYFLNEIPIVNSLFN
ncbi:peptidase domain-containing ABC transporter [Chryseotalea sanaruensis]|uniref:peptidase domain-containing ABC transporter n=1 Tax=Chryseotalea sanaruensis TaxID=2482724 RepID=UPI00135CC0E2|nr:peptidase domain-containing ABC transporter [Chryseotalea sanaruensis]